MSKLYKEYDALAYVPGAVAGDAVHSATHIRKQQRRIKGAEVVFDPKAHKEYVTGFRKRKQQRRAEAQKHITKKAKEERLQQRAERRTKLKHDLNLPDDYGVGSGGDDEAKGAMLDAEPAADVKVYAQGGVRTTVSVVQLDPDSDQAFSSSDEEEGGDDADAAGAASTAHARHAAAAGDSSQKHRGSLKQRKLAPGKRRQQSAAETEPGGRVQKQGMKQRHSGKKPGKRQSSAEGSKEKRAKGAN